MSMAHRTRKPARPQPFLEPRKRILVVSEGLTEKEYIDGYVQHRRLELVSSVEVKIQGQAGVPMTVVRKAKELKTESLNRARNEQDENLKFDSVWVVFDVDDHPRVNDAKIMAQSNRINCAVSNPCIELWLYLHFGESPGMQHRIRLRRLLKKSVSNYDKHVDFSNFKDGVDKAVSRARKLDEAAKADSDLGRNPTTGMWMLINEINEEPAGQ